jgi:hypothetical protein
MKGRKKRKRKGKRRRGTRTLNCRCPSGASTLSFGAFFKAHNTLQQQRQGKDDDDKRRFPCLRFLRPLLSARFCEHRFESTRPATLSVDPLAVLGHLPTPSLSRVGSPVSFPISRLTSLFSSALGCDSLCAYSLFSSSRPSFSRRTECCNSPHSRLISVHLLSTLPVSLQQPTNKQLLRHTHSTSLYTLQFSPTLPTTCSSFSHPHTQCLHPPPRNPSPPVEASSSSVCTSAFSVPPSAPSPSTRYVDRYLETVSSKIPTTRKRCDGLKTGRLSR